jgi:hypothetical protein
MALRGVAGIPIGEYDRCVESDRFDDVDFRMLDQPEPPPPRRGRRRGLLAVATVIAAGGLAAGASALASQDEPAAKPVASPKISISHGHRGGLCLREGGRHHSRRSEQDSTALRY